MPMLMIVSCVTSPYSPPRVERCTVGVGKCTCIRAINDSDFEVRDLTMGECTGLLGFFPDDYQLLQEYYDAIIEELTICKEQN